MNIYPIKVKYKNRIWDVFQIDFTRQVVFIERGNHKMGGIPFSQVEITQGNMRVKVLGECNK